MYPSLAPPAKGLQYSEINKSRHQRFYTPGGRPLPLARKAAPGQALASNANAPTSRPWPPLPSSARPHRHHWPFPKPPTDRDPRWLETSSRLSGWVFLRCGTPTNQGPQLFRLLGGLAGVHPSGDWVLPPMTAQCSHHALPGSRLARPWLSAACPL